MIDWLNLAANGLWILACALGLAGLSHASWNARFHGTGIRRYLQEISYQRVFALAGVLFCIGLGITAALTWEKVLWLVLALAFIIQLGLTYRPPAEHLGRGDH